MNNMKYPVHGTGLGLKRTLMGPLAENPPAQIDFLEVAPENWIGIGGKFGKQFRKFTEQYPFLAHGLSLSIGGPAPLDKSFVRQVKTFLDEHNIRAYSEHLSYCSDGGHLYDLMPIPFTEEAVHYVADRIRQVQDILERRITMENISYYAAPGQEMTEIDFINAVLDEADCDLLLDVNNIYVNSINHRYDAEAFLKSLPAERITYFHIAGHYQEAEDLLVDTHGAAVINTVWDLLDKAYQHFGIVPTLLERDFNIPPLAELLAEIDQIAEAQKKWSQPDGTNIAQLS
ncbi:MAG: DUF692 domain-containing protein [Gammaproteobacteria bacterium]|nr:MAG: DUF692 domain-containing protein [Gammaproteobacteria bacterium]